MEIRSLQKWKQNTSLESW